MAVTNLTTPAEIDFRPDLDARIPESSLWVIVHGSDLLVTTSGLFVPKPGPDIFFKSSEVLPTLKMLHSFLQHCYAVRVSSTAELKEAAA